MISTLFSSLNINVDNISEQANSSGASNESTLQPVLFVMEKTMPIFKEIGTIWCNDLSVIEVI